MKLDIIFEDDQIVIVNKPADILTIPHRFDTALPSLYGSLSAIYGKIFIVHRLDRETSGAIIFAKNEAAHRHLSIQFEKHETRKIYVALLDGALHQDEGEIDKPIAEHSGIAGKMVIAKRGKPSLTIYKATERFKHFTLVDADIRTGRTHQIRVHFQSMGYPLAIDALYGRRTEILLSEIKGRKMKLGKFDEERPIMNRTTLHAARLEFTHPVTLERLTFEAEMPKDFKALISQLGKWGV
jgi:23S rRNA pseudouridine1911/1915/1917 synthase